MYEYRPVKGHIEVFVNGEFQFSADTKEEAIDEVEKMEEEKCIKCIWGFRQLSLQLRFLR